MQPSPDGLAQAFLIGESFIGNDLSALVLGDNLYYGHDFHELLGSASQRQTGASVFAYHVLDPERYGVVEFDQAARPSAWKRSHWSRSRTTRSPACISTTSRWWTSPGT